VLLEASSRWDLLQHFPEAVLAAVLLAERRAGHSSRKFSPRKAMGKDRAMLARRLRTSRAASAGPRLAASASLNRRRAPASPAESSSSSSASRSAPRVWRFLALRLFPLPAMAAILGQGPRPPPSSARMNPMIPSLR